VLPPDRRLITVPGEDWLVAPITPAGFGLKRPEVIALWEAKSGPHPLATLTQPVQLTGGIGRVKQKMYILATENVLTGTTGGVSSYDCRSCR